MEGQVIENAVQETVQETVDKVSSNWDQIKAYFNGHIPDLISFGMKVVLSIVAFYVGTKLIKWLLKVAKRSMEKAGIDMGVAQFICSFGKFLLYLILIFNIATNFGVKESSVAALLGTAGVTIGLALQGGLDHVLASGENVNVMVFDTEMYSNTGGQASKASNIGEVCQFAASGKEVGKKSLAEIAMSYGYVYVAQIALGANMAQAVKVIAEAEAYNGPSLIIGYAPCELHGVKGGMNHCQDEMKKAVAAGYWNLFSFNPQLKAEGKNPFTLTSKPGDGSYQDFLNNETRYSRLTRAFPERAERLFKASEEAAKARYEHLQRLVELYK